MRATVGERELVDAAIKLATAMEPWASVVYCSVVDYVANVGCGEELRIPIEKPLTSTLEDLVHVLALRPDRDVPVGVLETAST